MGVDFDRLRLWVYGPKKTLVMPSKRVIPVGGKHFRDLRSTDAPAHELQRSDAFGGESSPPSGSRAKGDGLDAPLSQLRVGGRNLGIHHLRSTGTHHR